MIVSTRPPSMPPFLHFGGIFFALGLILATEARAEEIPKFHDVVEQYFQRWTHDGKGVLTDQRVKELVSSGEIRKAEAAAIAAIHCYQRKSGNGAQNLTRDVLLARHQDHSTLRRDQLASGVNVSANYQDFARHILSAPRSVFAVERPSLDTMTQGHLGDCYFIAAVGAHAHRNPESLLRLVHLRSDWSYDVRFPNGQHVILPPITDAQLALGSNAGQQGVWLNVLELAAGVALERHRKIDSHLPLDTLGGGGDPAFSIQLLTGHKTSRHYLRHTSKGQHPAPTEQELAHLKPQFAKLIRENLDRKRLICCGIGDWETPPGLAKKHIYAILGEKHGHVEIWNPWGYKYHFEPKGPKGLQHGYYVEGGHFSIPLHDFVKVFGAVTIETDEKIQ